MVCVDCIKCVIGWMMPIQHLLIRHTLDVMHIEKNVCESVIKFIIGVKDTFKVCRDMEVCGVREHLWLKGDPHNPGKIFQCRNPTLAKCGGEAQHSQSWGLGVLRDSRMFRVRQQGPKHLALGCSWCHWKGLEA